MTKFIVLTLFEEMFTSFVSTSVIGRAREENLVSIRTMNIRDYTQDKHRRVDFPPYGGGSGMILACQPLASALDQAITLLQQEDTKQVQIIYLSPRGKKLTYSTCKELATQEVNYILICGHYEGIDERIIEEYNIQEISIGDYVLTGGELASQVLMDSIIRLLPGVLSPNSLVEESHTEGLLEYPQYTKPEVFRGRKVPDILLSGNHPKIKEYRHKEAIRMTIQHRPDLYEQIQESNYYKKGGKL